MQLTDYACKATEASGTGEKGPGGADGGLTNPLPNLGVAAVLGLLGAGALSRHRA